jgi:N-acetylglutamate synthase-like GNAT family acetyltransferase
MNIRNATDEDIDEIVALSARFAREVPAWGLVTRTGDEIRKMDKQLVWVVEENDRLIGYAACLPRENDGSCIYTENDKILEIDEIYLVPEAHGRGVGSQLLEEISNSAGKAGYTKLFVYSSVKSLESVLDFYRDNGFKTWAVQLFKELV